MELGVYTFAELRVDPQTGATIDPEQRVPSRRSLYNNGITIDWEVTMKGASKPKKLGKKVAQKSLKEKRQDKRAAAKKGFGSS